MLEVSQYQTSNLVQSHSNKKQHDNGTKTDMKTNRTEDPEINHIGTAILFSTKVPKTYIGEKNTFFNKWC
jgi:hypothetical protein